MPAFPLSRLAGLATRTYDIDRLDNRDPDFVDFAYRACHGVLQRYFRSEVRGVEGIPPGPALYVGNHNAAPMTPDSFLFAFEVYRQRGLADLPYGLGHEHVIRIPGIHQLIVPLGAVKARHESAIRLFEQGHKVLVYPGGDVDSLRPWRDRARIVFDGRRGYVRLALTAGVPIVPVVAAGAHETMMVLGDAQWLVKLLRIDHWARVKRWPVALALPWGLMLGPGPFLPFPSRILVEVLPALTFDRRGPEAAGDEAYVARCAAEVEGAMQEALTRLSVERRS
jgi:1-acyl-sn-glycerol-3-phosphate acyltransferase